MAAVTLPTLPLYYFFYFKELQVPPSLSPRDRGHGSRLAAAGALPLEKLTTSGGESTMFK